MGTEFDDQFLSSTPERKKTMTLEQIEKELREAGLPSWYKITIEEGYIVVQFVDEIPHSFRFMEGAVEWVRAMKSAWSAGVRIATLEEAAKAVCPMCHDEFDIDDGVCERTHIIEDEEQNENDNGLCLAEPIWKLIAQAKGNA